MYSVFQFFIYNIMYILRLTCVFFSVCLAPSKALVFRFRCKGKATLKLQQTFSRKSCQKVRFIDLK